MRITKPAGIASAVTLTALLLVGCSSTSSSEFDATTVQCTDVVTELSSAQEELRVAQAAFSESEGTPGEISAQAEIDATTAKIEALQERSASTECAPEEEEEPVVEETSDALVCTTWAEDPIDWATYESTRYFEDGLVSINEATTEEEAYAATMEWLSIVKTDRGMLTGAATYFNIEADSSTLFDEDGCATADAVALVTEMSLALTKAETTPDTAPETGWNSGVREGEDGTTQVVRGESQGVYDYGDGRKAVKVVLEDGTILWIMSRCGNIVTPGKPELPPGETDNPKDWSLSVDPPEGVTPQGLGPRTDGQESERQQASGDTSGRVTDSTVNEDTKSGDTTSDIGTTTDPGTGKEENVVVAEDAEAGGDDRSDDVSGDADDDEEVFIYDDGGTSGTEGTISDPDA